VQILAWFAACCFVVLAYTSEEGGSYVLWAFGLGFIALWLADVGRNSNPQVAASWKIAVSQSRNW
jgi:hypothetical protein